jgi:hypothetical protein
MRTNSLTAIFLVGVVSGLPQGIGQSDSVNDLDGLLGGNSDPFFSPFLVTASKTTHTHIFTVSPKPTFYSASIHTSTSVSLSSDQSSDSPTFSVSSLANPVILAPTETPSPSATDNQLLTGSRTWKIVGVSLIVITFVAVTTFVVVFFDHWWRFLRDLLFRKGTASDFEDLVPDWEKRTWEIRLAEEGGHRYPTLSASDALSRQPSTNRNRLDDKRNLFPIPPYPQQNVAGIGLGFSADHCPAIYPQA